MNFTGRQPLTPSDNLVNKVNRISNRIEFEQKEAP